jgi:hypothetical protein
VLDPSQKLKIYKDKSSDSGATPERSFCGECGSTLFTTNERFPDIVIVPSGNLDYEALVDWRPQGEFFCKRRGDWLRTAGADGGSKFEGRNERAIVFNKRFPLKFLR